MLSFIVQSNLILILNANSYLLENVIALSVYTAIVVDTVISKVSSKTIKIMINLQNKVDASSFSFSEPNKTRI